jgi:hypothetical protein
MTTAEYVDCLSLPPGSTLDVETRNRRYRIECLGGRHIRISGHPDLCPTPVPGTLAGSSDKSGALEPGLIGAGRYLQFLLNNRPVTTTRVLKVRVDRAAARPTSASIH